MTNFPGPQPAFEGLWTVKNVAEFLQCSRDFVYEHAEDGTLPCLRIGGLLRFDPESIRRWARGELSPTRVLPAPRASAEALRPWDVDLAAENMEVPVMSLGLPVGTPRPWRSIERSRA